MIPPPSVHPIQLGAQIDVDVLRGGAPTANGGSTVIDKQADTPLTNSCLRVEGDGTDPLSCVPLQRSLQKLFLSLLKSIEIG
jgi:hypothetical protein